jgi:hypothetical protein
MTYPESSDVSSGQPTLAAHYNNLRKDAIRLGKEPADAMHVGEGLKRYQSGITISYLATNRLRVPFITTNPATLMINGFMLQATANVDLPSSSFSGGAATWYIFAIRTAGSQTFTLGVNTSASEGTDQRIIGECYYDGANVISIKDYFRGALGDADYDSGWFACAYNNTYTKAHGLAVYPRLVTVEHSANASGTGEIVQILVNSASAVMSSVGYDGVNVYVTTANNATNGVVFSTRRASAGGYMRIRAWR